MEKCQQVVAVDSMEDRNSLGLLILLVSIIVGSVLMLTIYTLGCLYIGFYLGKRANAHPPGGGSSAVQTRNKQTMTPVTYTSVRKVSEPRFDFSPHIDGCWEP